MSDLSDVHKKLFGSMENGWHEPTGKKTTEVVEVAKVEPEAEKVDYAAISRKKFETDAMLRDYPFVEPDGVFDGRPNVVWKAEWGIKSDWQLAKVLIQKGFQQLMLPPRFGMRAREYYIWLNERFEPQMPTMEEILDIRDIGKLSPREDLESKVERLVSSLDLNVTDDSEWYPPGFLDHEVKLPKPVEQIRETVLPFLAEDIESLKKPGHTVVREKQEVLVESKKQPLVKPIEPKSVEITIVDPEAGRKTQREWSIRVDEDGNFDESQADDDFNFEDEKVFDIDFDLEDLEDEDEFIFDFEDSALERDLEDGSDAEPTLEELKQNIRIDLLKLTDDMKIFLKRCFSLQFDALIRFWNWVTNFRFKKPNKTVKVVSKPLEVPKETREAWWNRAKVVQTEPGFLKRDNIDAWDKALAPKASLGKNAKAADEVPIRGGHYATDYQYRNVEGKPKESASVQIKNLKQEAANGMPTWVIISGIVILALVLFVIGSLLLMLSNLV